MSFMELLASSARWPDVLVALYFVPLMAAIAYFTRTKRRKTAPLPPGPRRLPILGNLHNLFGTEVPHQRLAELARDHGPLMHLQLGQIPTVVASSCDAARAVLKTHDHTFADRPPLLAAKEMAYGARDVALAPYGEYWRTMKKIAVVELLTARRVASFRGIRDAAVAKVLGEVLSRAAASEPVDLSQHLLVVGNWTVSRAAFGSADCSNDHLDYVGEIMNEIVVLAAGMNLADFFPAFESLISAVTGLKRRMREVFSKMDGVLDSIVKEHMSKYEAGNTAEQKDEDQDLLDLLLRHYRLQDLDFPLSVNDIKAVVMDMFIAGTDTSASTLEWAMAELMKNPDVMQKAQAEVRRVYEEKGKMDESVTDELHYLKLVVKETLRVHPPVPLLLPRQSREACEINGYRIPAKTRVLVNAWALGRDPKYWVKPDVFNPDRFHDLSVDFKGTDYQYMPFGAGRRMCPGATFALANVDIALAKLLCHFDWKLPDGMGPEDLNMDETSGATIHKKVPLCLIASLHIPIEMAS